MKTKLYHYSDKDIKSIKPVFFGNNLYTLNDTRQCNIKRSFFYLTATPKEYIFKNSNYLYITKINPKNLYDLRSDKLNLKVKYSGNIKGLLSYCKRYYKGIIYNVGFDIVCLFSDIKILKQVKRKKSLLNAI